jgi:hypothetical protein
MREDLLTSFIERLRDRLDIDRGNAVAIAFSQVTELMAYLRVIADDYELANEQVMGYIEARRQSFTEGTHQLTAGEIEQMEQHREASRLLHLRIDTFYVFAKILLDKIGPLLEALFGQGVAASLERHSKLIRNLDDYAGQRGLTPVPEDLTSRMNGMDVIVEYRDNWITHDSSPRTVKGTTYDLRSRQATTARSRIYPRAGETVAPQPTSPRALLPEIEAYVEAVFDYIEANESAIQ